MQTFIVTTDTRVGPCTDTIDAEDSDAAAEAILELYPSGTTVTAVVPA